jgi:hypothetical protein
MPRVDIRLKATWPDHPKTERLVRRCGPDASRCLLRLWIWASQERPDGDLTGLTVEDVEIVAKWNGDPGAFYDAITELKWIDPGPKIHDWAEHQPFIVTSSSRSESAKKAAAARWHPDASRIGNGCSAHAPRMRPARFFDAPTPTPKIQESPHIPPLTENAERMRSASQSQEYVQSSLREGLGEEKTKTETKTVDLEVDRVWEAWLGLSSVHGYALPERTPLLDDKIRTALEQPWFREAWQKSAKRLLDNGPNSYLAGGGQHGWKASLVWFLSKKAQEGIQAGMFDMRGSPAFMDREYEEFQKSLESARKYFDAKEAAENDPAKGS